MGRPDPRAVIRKLLSIRQLVGPLAGPVTRSADVRPASAALTEPRLPVSPSGCLFREQPIMNSRRRDPYVNSRKSDRAAGRANH
jgi:hypothetical protein